ncbi:MAG: arginine N-succinyltransferase [Bacteriovoracaceae bacterium]|jgi:arginine N-succinyltransferase|nr:arginine N-succinyltransferase [Bacteriovoracaceae bacterium]
MYLLRSAIETDLEDLYKLSQLITFINLPADKEVILRQIKKSITSFKNKNQSKKLYNDYFLFILQDVESREVIGASMIHGQHGTDEVPHFYLSVSQENKFSSTINTGFIHGTLKLGIDTDGPTEIGGLIINPNFRGHPLKLGKQISFVRFLYMALHPHKFKETIHSELMPPFDTDGNSPLWEAIGRRFMNMDYHEADLLSRDNKEFIINLFPSEVIYETLLPLEARNSIGKVGKATQPVKKMLESIGFKYTNEVDPFDGGPHYRCKLKDVTLIKSLNNYKIEVANEEINFTECRILSLENDKYQFSAAVLPCETKDNVLIISKESFDRFEMARDTLYNGIDF